MKKVFYILALAIPLHACGDDPQSDISLSPVWEIGGLRTPESVLYHEDESAGFLFVAEIDGNGDVVDGKGGIAKLSLDGDILEQDWVPGLNAPKGMGVYQGKLYVADITEVAVIDIASRKVEARIPVPDSKFLNDIAVDDKGTVYVSDTHTNRVHRIQDQSPEVYFENINGANGLTSVGSDLYIAAGPELWKADADKQLTKIAEGFEEGADGVEMIKPGEFIVTCWAGLIYHVSSDGSVEKLLDSRDKKMNTADLGWNPDKGIIYVPTFFKNSVIAYHL